MKNLLETLIKAGIVWLFLLNFITLGILLYYWGGVGLTFGASAWIAFKFWIGSAIVALGAVFGGVWISFIRNNKKM